VGFTTLGETIAANFTKFSGHVLIAATGLVVRLIAPSISDKKTDPAVVCLGQDGSYVISLLSGHLGGANDLARSVAAVTGGQPVINTATDLAGVPALEVLASELGLIPESLLELPAISRILVDGGRITVQDDGGFLWPHLSAWPESFSLVPEKQSLPAECGPALAVDYRLKSFGPGVMVLRPPALSLGVGCHLEATEDELMELLTLALAANGLSLKSISRLATIDRRADPTLAPAALAARLGCLLLSFPPDRLSPVEVPTPSETVLKNIGVPSVCEAAAILAARGGPLLVPKMKSARATCALALIDWT
jgi:cobalt-precorrin 5A hydrolase